MDEKLLGRAIEFHGPDFLRQLQLEQQNMPPNIFLHLQRHRPHPPEIDDPQFIMNVRRFISKKADMLFQPVSSTDVPQTVNPQDDDEDCFAKMPPLETFMGIDPNTCRRHFFNSLRVKDIVIGIVTSILDSGLVLQLLCLDDDKNRDIDSLRITAFVPVKEIPKMFPTQNPTEGYQVQDFIRGVVANVNIETENILVSLSDRDLQDRPGTLPHLGLIHEEDFPVQYRRKLHIRGLTFDELLNSIMGFTNPGNVKYLLRTLDQGEEVSMMRGLHRLKIPEKEYAESLKKQQSQKMAYKNVAQGIAFFKEGRQTEAMQQLNKALQIDQKNVEALVARGALYANNESYNRAIEDFEEALRENKKHPNAIKYMHETLLAKGKGHEDSGDWDDAEDCYKRALDLQPDSREAQESIRYVKYRKESGKGSKPEKKSFKEKSKSPPYHTTTVTLKKLIDEDQKSRKKKPDIIKQEPRRKSRKYSSSSSSSSSSRSRSRSDNRSRSSKQRSRSPRGRSQKKKSRSPSPRKQSSKRMSRSPDKAREYKDEESYKDRRPSSDASNRIPDKHAVGQDYSFFSKSDRIPFLDSSPQREEIVEKVAEEAKENKPIDDEDDDLYGDSMYEKPDRNVPVVDVKPAPQRPDQHYEYGYGNQKIDSPSQRGDRLEVKESKEVSVTPTRDEINDRLGLEDISPDVNDDRRNDNMKYRPGHDGKGEKRTLRISKPWSPDERKYESKGNGYSRDSRDYDRGSPRHSDRGRESPRRHTDRERGSPRRHADRDSDRSDHHRRSSYDRRSYERDYDRQQDDGAERRVISVGRKSGQDTSRRYDDEQNVDEYQERRSIVVKKKRVNTPPESRDTEYISHVISAQALERKQEYSSRHRSRSRSGSRSRYRSRSNSRSRRSRSNSRSRSARKRYKRDSPDRNEYDRQSSRETRDQADRQKGRDMYDNRRDDRSRSEGQYRRSRSHSRERREVRGQDRYHEDYHQMEQEQVRSMKDRYESTEDKYIMHEITNDKPRRFEDERDIPSRGSNQQRFEEEREESKPLTDNLSDIFADLPAPRAKKNTLSMAFATYVPRAVKMKQHQPEVSLNPESRPPPHSVQPVYQPNRDRNVTEIKDQVFSLTKSQEMKHEREFIDFSARGITVSKPRPEYRRSRSPNERSERSGDSQKYRSRSPEIKRSIQVQRVAKRSRSGSRSPVRSARKSDARSRSRSRDRNTETRTPDKKYVKRYEKSRSRSHSSERKRKGSARRSSKRSESRSRSRSPSPLDGRLGRHIFPAARSMKKSRSPSPHKHDRSRDSKRRSYSRSRSRSRSRESERRSIKITKSDKKATTTKTPKPEVDLPAVKSKWDSPEEKSSRWDETHLRSSGKYLEMPLMIASAQEQAQAIANNVALISSSPPPHRQMKPEEKKKMEQKWKEFQTLEDSVPETEDSKESKDSKLYKSVEARARDIERRLNTAVDSLKGNDKKSKGKGKKTKKMSDHGMRSKWDSDSGSSSSSPKRGQRSRSYSSSTSRSRSRSRDRDGKKSASKKSPEKVAKGKKSGSSDTKSENKDDQKVFWFHKEEITGYSTEKKSKKSSKKSKKSQSKSPKRKRSRSRSRKRSKSPSWKKKSSKKEDINKNPFNTKSKTSNTAASTSGVTPFKIGSSKPVKIEEKKEKKKDSLQEMEQFLSKLKTDKKMKDQQRPSKK